ncbi:hypothetical protein AVW11_04120 [Streptomyces amritsarensis]|uniref:Uncharacterized protein n=1 Tax=Streptomyces amritsarensis TaxID=681158 RepID=A0ABX3G8X3_9ACTN|nr:hypothetical protein [Streptomyces amritsarensis]OLZ72586.1 hypothetical protein AVW11_04120 [Streptomyces amritsarensis]
MPKGIPALDRRFRRLKQLQDSGQVGPVNEAMKTVWQGGNKPERVYLRSRLLLSGPKDLAPPLTQLLAPRGIALRFYLLSVFEAHCRLKPGEAWTSSRKLTGHLGWSDFVAVDSAYSSQKGGVYLRENVLQERDGQSSRVRQVQGALRALETVGGEGQALVQVPRKKNGTRDYEAFSLMPESGRGKLLTPADYVVPEPAARGVFSIPSDFFLQGWVQVLTPAEVATWLILQLLSQAFPAQHSESGVYLYAKRREGLFRLKRDSYEDSCNALRNLGLIREPRQPEPVATDTESPVEDVMEVDPRVFDFSFMDFDLDSPPKYEPNRHQVADDGLHQPALETALKEVVIWRDGKNKAKHQ